MDRLFGTLELRAVNDDLREFEGIANTDALDSYGTVIDPAGARFTLPMPLLWHHDQKTPVGEVVEARLINGQWRVRGQIRRIPEPGPVQEATDRAWQNVKYGLVRGLSIGFDPLKKQANRFIEWMWRELSLVTIPSNSEATIMAVRAAFGATLPGVSGTPAIIDNPRQGRAMTILEQVREHENSRAAKVARQAALMQRAADEGRTLDASEGEEYDTIATEVRGIDEHLVRLNDLERANRAAAVAVNGAGVEQASASRGAVAVVRTRAPQGDGMAMARVVRALALAHRQHRDVETVARGLYPDDQLIQRAAVAAHTTSNSDALVSDEGGVYADFVEYLRPQTIIGQFGTNGVPALRRVPFRTPLITQTGAGSGYWVGEGEAKPVTSFAWTRTTIEPLKAANIAVITDELLRSSSPAADAMIRDSLVEALRARLDTDFIDPAKAASAGVSPASITNGLTPLTSAGGTADDVRTDLQAIFGAFIGANNAPTTGVWVMSATRALALSLMMNALGQQEFQGLSMRGGTFQGLPVIVSEYVADDDVFLVNAADVYLADEGGFAVDASRDASLQMADNPTNSSATPTATTLVSMFQTNSMAIRAERTINWARRRDSGVVHLNATAWAP